MFFSRNIPVVRRKFSDVSRGGSLDESKRLIMWAKKATVMSFKALTNSGLIIVAHAFGSEVILNYDYNFFHFSRMIEVLLFSVILFFRCTLMALCRDGQEVAVVYYRYGYMPQHYTEEVEHVVCLQLLGSLSMSWIHHQSVIESIVGVRGLHK